MKRTTTKQKAKQALDGLRVVVIGAVVCLAAIVILSTEQGIIDTQVSATAVA